ncbi:MAG: PAS domain-containing protein, partial [Pseudomonadota bacterium]|nr:PAS domain-containing protein [Pseudomonadota bacterium]
MDNQYYALSLTAIPDITGTNFAYLIGLNQSSELAALASRYHHHITTMSSLILLIGLGLVLMLRSLRRNKRQAQYLKSINDTISEGLYVTDQYGNITVANDAAQKILGYSGKQLVGKSASKLFLDRDSLGLEPKQDSPLELAYKQGQSFTGELHFLTADDRDIWVDISCQPLINQDEIQGSVTVFTDISESKAKDDALRISATAFETQDGIMITSANGIILRVNQAFTRLTGYQSEEVIGLTPKVLSSNRQRPSFYEDMWHKLKENRFWQGEIWNRKKDGEVYLEWLTITAVLDEQ